VSTGIVLILLLLVLGLGAAVGALVLAPFVVAFVGGGFSP
jgi:hypothetical protein